MISRPLPPLNQPDATIDALYGMIVAQARSPAFYRDYGVPDTVDGRFDMIVLHLVLCCARLTGSSAGAVDALPGSSCSTGSAGIWTHNLREMGVGDLTVPEENAAGRRGILRPRRRPMRARLAAGDATAL